MCTIIVAIQSALLLFPQEDTILLFGQWKNTSLLEVHLMVNLEA